MVARAVARVAVAALVLGVLAVPALARGATPQGDNARTLTVSVPGPFNGCSVLDPGATPTTSAVLDLVRPSAFLTTAGGQLVGEGGAIATAELTSLSPETVVYTISPRQLWSNGLTFNGADLVAWWQRARSEPSVQSDGYRDIQSLTVGSNGLTVTAIFATPFAAWDLLFRDVEARGTTSGCDISNLVKRPSLGPYKVASATASRVVLAMNTEWTADPTRFGRVVLVTSPAIPARAATPFATYTLAVTKSHIEALSAHPSVASRLGTSSNIEVLSFAPVRPVTASLSMRKVLSWSIDRQTLINHLWGSITFSPSVAQSAVFSQGQADYPGPAGTTPTTPTTTPSTTVLTDNGLADCLACAEAELASAGYHRSGRHWVDPARKTFSVKVISGPTAVDRSTAAQVVAQWRALGIVVTLGVAASDVAAAESVARDHADVAVYAKPTTSEPSEAARAWSGAPYPDSYDGGWRSAAVTSLFASAVSNFNAAAATTTWLQLDQAVQHTYWVRPLFTAPSLIEWSNLVVGVNASLSVAGFLDQVVSWNTATPAAG